MKIQARWACKCFRLFVVFGLLWTGFGNSANAQGFRGGDGGRGFGGGFPSPEESFRRMDRNQNGLIEPDELPGFFRDMYARAGIDISRPIDLQQFTQASQKMREQFEQARASGDFSQFRRPDGGGGPPSFGGGPPSFGGGPPSFGGGPPSSSRSEESSSRDSRRDDRDRDRDRDRERDRDSSSSSGKPTKKTVKQKVRITKELPNDYREKDKNGDGQIGLYEWDRSAFSQFFNLDRNGDGLLTADELIAATKKSSSTSQSASAGISTPSASAPTGSRPTTVDLSRPAPTSAVPNTASTSSPASTVSAPTSPGMKVFVGLDSNSDGTLTEEEWQRSRTARGKFEKAGIAISFPIQQAQFVELYKKVEAQ